MPFVSDLNLIGHLISPLKLSEEANKCSSQPHSNKFKNKQKMEANVFVCQNFRGKQLLVLKISNSFLQVASYREPGFQLCLHHVVDCVWLSH